MTLLVTGGTGFIGSYFLQLALAAGHEVFAIRRPGSRPRAALTQEPQWIDGDLATIDPAMLTAHSVKLESAVLVHLAAYGVSPQPCTWENAFQFNVTDGLSFIRRAIDAGLRRVVVCGSCVEYGRSGERYDVIPPETALEPIGAYAASKAALSIAVTALCRERGFELAIVRPFAVFGEGQHSSNFWPALRTAALGGKDFEMTPGGQVRDYVPVEDVARAFVNAVERGDLVGGQPLIRNVGSGQPVTMREFAEYWWRQWKAPGRLLPGALPYRPNEVMRYVPLV